MIVLPDQKFNPNFQDIILSSTKLAPGVSLAKFLGTKGNPCSLTTVPKYQNDQTERKQLARNLYLHAELFRSVNGNTDMFKDVRLIVTEGVYRGGPIETVAGDNLTKQEGRLVVYKVVGEDGKIDYERTFDLAVFWKDYMNYDKLSLEYDMWNPNGVLNAQIAVETPKVPESFDVSFGGKVQTNFNGSLLSADELTEVLEDV
mgnify:FL=1|jgi:hypothetical protein|tara:strand:+ start:144 stop:749 length:606 start_codon:yes stop_codon:yes gene_type:complete